MWKVNNAYAPESFDTIYSYGGTSISFLKKNLMDGT